MSFEDRDVEITFILNKDTFDNGDNQLVVSGLRCQITIENAGGYTGSMATLEVWGMSESDMNHINTFGQIWQKITNREVIVRAGNASKNTMSQVFAGTIADANIEYMDAPNVSLYVIAQTGYGNQLMPAAPNSAPGSTDVAQRISTLAQSIGFKVVNHGVTSYLTDHYSYGSAIEQIRDIARAAQIDIAIANNQVDIWPTQNGDTNEEAIILSPETGLVGYPSCTNNGVRGKAEFNPDITRLRQLNITGSVKQGSGTFFVQNVTHQLSCQLPNGPWFTEFVAAVPRVASV